MYTDVVAQKSSDGGRRRYPSSIRIDKTLERIMYEGWARTGEITGGKTAGALSRLVVLRENAAFRGLGSKAPTGRHADAEFRQIGTWPHNAAHYIQKR